MYRMTDLVEYSGFSRHAIDKYRKIRLLPPPKGARHGEHSYWTADHLRILLELRAKLDDAKRLNGYVLDFQTDPRFAHLYPATERHPDLDD